MPNLAQLFRAFNKHGMKLDIANPSWIDPTLQEDEPSTNPIKENPQLHSFPSFQPSVNELIDVAAKRVSSAGTDLIFVLNNLRQAAANQDQRHASGLLLGTVGEVMHLIGGLVKEMHSGYRNIKNLSLQVKRLLRLIDRMELENKHLRTQRINIPQIAPFAREIDGLLDIVQAIPFVDEPDFEDY
jgi:hypothetical protein